MTTDELKQLCAYWQKVLRLRDWDIDARIERIFDMPEKEIRGHVSYTIALKEAIIQILDPNDYFKDDYSPEQSLVHELLHVAFAEAGDATTVEQAVDATAKALVNLNRKGGDR
jgi:hypothetical protein